MTPGQEPTRCPTCDDYGRVADDPCPTCSDRLMERQCPACHKMQYAMTEHDPCLFCEAPLPSARPTYYDIDQIRHMRRNRAFGFANFAALAAPPIPDEDVIA